MDKLERKRLTILGAACAAAVACAGIAGWLVQRFGPGTYARQKTKFGRASVYQVEDDEGQAVRLLAVNGIVQSGMYVDDDRYTDLVFEYLKRYDTLFDLGVSGQRICVLGCGGYDYPKHLIAHHPDVAVDAVEIDPAITDIARRYFGLDRLIEEYDTEHTGRLNLICADALDHLRTPGPIYDAIVNDAFDAGKPPAHLTTREFLNAAHERLAPGGIYATNIVSALGGSDAAFLHEQVALMKTEFGNVRILPCATDSFSEADNVVVLAWDQATNQSF